MDLINWQRSVYQLWKSGICVCLWFKKENIFTPHGKPTLYVSKGSHEFKGKDQRHFTNNMFSFHLPVLNHCKMPSSYNKTMHTALVHKANGVLWKQWQKQKSKGQLGTHAFISFSSHFAIQRFSDITWVLHGRIVVEEEDSPLLKILRGDNREWSTQLFFHLLGGLTLLNESIETIAMWYAHVV